MKRQRPTTRAGVIGLLLLAMSLTGSRPARPHCDTMDGPVVTTARAALEKGDVEPVLKWVKEEHEAAVRAAFRQTRTVRTKGPAARDLADRYFLETLVRLHREGEGAPFTGLKPAGTDLPRAVEEADSALDTGSVDHLVDLITRDVAAGIRERFARTRALERHAETNVDAGREYVEAYVEYVHYVERLHRAATTSAHEAGAGHDEHGASSAKQHDEHTP